MKKRVTSLFLALLMAVTLLPVQVLAEEPAAPDTAADTHQAAEVQEPVETETETDAPVPQKSAQARSIPVRWAKTSAGRWTPAPAR